MTRTNYSSPIKRMLIDKSKARIKKCKEKGWPTNVYLYNLSHSHGAPKISIRKGCIYYRTSPSGLTMSASFINSEDLADNIYQVGVEEGKLFSGALWLKRKNDKKAIRIFIAQQKDKLQELANTMEKTRDRITSLELMEKAMDEDIHSSYNETK